MKERGLDLIDLSMGGNTDDVDGAWFNEPSAWVEKGARVKREVGIPVTVSWNLGVPQNADRAIREGKLDLVLLGRPALANPHWPVWAARELGHEDPFGLVPEDWAWWLRNFRGHQGSVGWPETGKKDEKVEKQEQFERGAKVVESDAGEGSTGKV
jgi:tRNA-dihydrouridine synthase